MRSYLSFIRNGINAKIPPRPSVFIKLSTTEVSQQERGARTALTPEVSSSTRPPSSTPRFHALHFQVPYGPQLEKC